MSAAAINRLLEAAYVREDRKEAARKELERLFDPDPRLFNPATRKCKSLAKSTYDAGKQRGTAKPHNEKMMAVEGAASKLQKALLALRLNPYTHDQFWGFEPFGPIMLDEVERPSVMWSIEAVRKAAIAGRKKATRRRESENYNLAFLAALFFRRFSEEKAFSSEAQKLVHFTQAVFSVVTGKSHKDVNFRDVLSEATQRIKVAEKAHGRAPQVYSQ